MEENKIIAYQMLTILRQRLDQRIDAEQFRVINVDNSDKAGTLINDLHNIIDTSMYKVDYEQ